MSKADSERPGSGLQFNKEDESRSFSQHRPAQSAQSPPYVPYETPASVRAHLDKPPNRPDHAMPPGTYKDRRTGHVITLGPPYLKGRQWVQKVSGKYLLEISDDPDRPSRLVVNRNGYRVVLLPHSSPPKIRHENRGRSDRSRGKSAESTSRTPGIGALDRLEYELVTRAPDAAAKAPPKTLNPAKPAPDPEVLRMRGGKAKDLQEKPPPPTVRPAPLQPQKPVAAQTECEWLETNMGQMMRKSGHGGRTPLLQHLRKKYDEDKTYEPAPVRQWVSWPAGLPKPGFCEWAIAELRKMPPRSKGDTTTLYDWLQNRRARGLMYDYGRHKWVKG